MATMSYSLADLRGHHFENAFHRLSVAGSSLTAAPVHKNWNDTSLGFSLVSVNGMRFYCDALYVRQQR